MLRKIKHVVDEKLYNRLHPTSSKLGSFYGTAKVHKLREREGVDIIKGDIEQNQEDLENMFKGYGFLSFARKFGDKYGKELMDTVTKTGIDAAKTASKRVVQKTAEATGDLIGNKTTDKITSIRKPKEKEKAKEIEEIYIAPEKRQQTIDGLKLF